MLKYPREVIQKIQHAYAGRRVCVTGGAGFIGGHLVDALLSLNAEVTVIDDLSNATGEHLGSMIEIEPDRLNFIHASILDDRALNQAVEGSDLLFHLAALSSVPRSIEDPERSFEVNALGTLRVAIAARRHALSRVVYSASSSAYGDQPTLPKVESQRPMPISPYAVGKLTGEEIMLAWAHSYSLSTVSLRYFNIFGPRQPADSPYAAVIAVFAKKFLAAEPPTIFGDGGQSRDFTYVTNAVIANLLAGASPKPLAGEVVNIGTGRQLTLAELASLIAKRCDVPHIRPTIEAPRVGDVRHSLADISAARELLGYEPAVSVEAGLDETIAWYRSAYADAS